MPERQTKATQERHERMLLELLKIPGNDRCADCGLKNPRWASYSLGVFLCIRCAGLHRKMGTHISRVKSVTMDQWTAEQIEMIRKSGGNDEVNSIVNPHPEQHPLPLADDDDDRAMEKYVRLKWEKRAFMDPPPMPARPTTLNINTHTQNVPKRSSSVPVFFRDNDNYTPALAKLREMGFKDEERNRQVLRQTQGSFEAAVDILSRMPGAQIPMATGPALTDQQKMMRLNDLGFTDVAANRDALRRSGGNLDVAIDILRTSRKASVTVADSLTSSSLSTPQEFAGRAQTANERQAHKLPGSQTGTLLDVDDVNTTPTNVSNPFHMSYQLPPQQQQPQQSLFATTSNPFTQTAPVNASMSVPVQPQVTGFTQNNFATFNGGLQAQLTGFPSSPSQAVIQPTPTGSSNPFSQMTGSSNMSPPSTPSNNLHDRFAMPQRSFTAPTLQISSGFSLVNSPSLLQIPQQQPVLSQQHNAQIMPTFTGSIPNQSTGFQNNSIFASTLPNNSSSVPSAPSGNPWASSNPSGTFF